MKLNWNARIVKPSLNAHTWFGLVSGAFLYLIAVSGTLSVFFEEFDRWEQPNVPEYSSYEPELMASTIEEYIQRIGRTPESVYIVLPTKGFPRTHVTDGIDEWYLDENGNFLTEPNVPWTMLVRELHAHLLMPHLVGMSIVGLIGVLCLALIISGVLAHPSIFKDAFLWRAGKTRRVQEMDFHNRLGVWGLPFHFMISLTGAFIGLSSLLMGLTSLALYSGDPEDVVEAIYGKDPILSNQSSQIDFSNAFQSLMDHEPNADPIYVVVHKYGQDDQLVEIAATLPNRLSYSEMYRFDSSGEWINKQGLTEGDVGGQVAYSTYRLHYGHFDTGWVKVMYALMGIAFTYLVASGINIWLARRKYQTWVNHLWSAWVWGVLIGFAASCWMSMLGLNPVSCFFFILIGLLIVVTLFGRRYGSAGYLYLLLSMNLVLIPIIYLWKHHELQWHLDYVAVLIGCLVIAALFAFRAVKRIKINLS